MTEGASSRVERTVRRGWVVGIALVILIVLSILMKSGYYRNMPFLPDGDSYFHGMLANYISQTGKTTVFVPYEVPELFHGYPFNFHILVTQLHDLTGLSILSIMRWFGPLASAAIGLAVYLLTKRLSRSDVAGLAAMSVLLFIPFFDARLAASFPENVMVFDIPILLLMLIDAVSHRRRAALFAAGLLIISAIGMHFSSYLLVPVFGLGVLLYYSGRHWRWRNIGLMSLYVVTLVVLVMATYSNWWVIGFLKSFFKTYSGAALEASSPLRGYTLPAPSSGQWIDQLGFMALMLAGVGTLWLLLNRGYTHWRAKLITAGFVLTVLLPLQILPALKLFSYTPFRAFLYLAPVIAVLAGLSLQWFKRFPQRSVMAVLLGSLVITLLPNSSLPVNAGPGEQHLTKGEFRGIEWLAGHTSATSLVFTAPANGRQIALYTRQAVSYDSSEPVFFAVSAPEAIAEIKKFGNYSPVYIYVSQYKLGPVYNFGELRAYAFVTADLEKFNQPKYFSRVYEDKDSLIYQARIPE